MRWLLWPVRALAGTGVALLFWVLTVSFMPNGAPLCLFVAWAGYFAAALLREKRWAAGVSSVASGLGLFCFWCIYVRYWWSAPRLAEWWWPIRGIAAALGAGIFGGLVLGLAPMVASSAAIALKLGFSPPRRK